MSSEHPIFVGSTKALRFEANKQRVMGNTERSEHRDPLGAMLREELGIEEVREIEGWLLGEHLFVDIGFGGLYLETYGGLDAKSAGTFRLRHDTFGTIDIGRSALMTALNDRIHEIRRDHSTAGRPHSS